MTIHRRHGIPDHVVELLGPPPVVHKAEQEPFFALLGALAAEQQPQTIQQWSALWDIAYCRREISRLQRACATVVGLQYDNACAEIARPSLLRLTDQLVTAVSTKDDDQGAIAAAADENAVVHQLQRLGLHTTARLDLACALAAPVTSRMHAHADHHRKVERDCLAVFDAPAKKRGRGPAFESVIEADGVADLDVNAQDAADAAKPVASGSMAGPIDAAPVVVEPQNADPVLAPEPAPVDRGDSADGQDEPTTAPPDVAAWSQSLVAQAHAESTARERRDRTFREAHARQANHMKALANGATF